MGRGKLKLVRTDLWKERQQKTVRDDSLQPFVSAWKAVSTQIVTYCWKLQDVEKHDRPHLSARHLMIQGRLLIIP